MSSSINFSLVSRSLRVVANWGLVGAIAATTASCTSLTFSEEGAIDFENYSSVHVEVELRNGGAHSSYASYLADELQRVSGFETVSAGPSGPTQVVLSVVVAVDAVTDGDGDVDYAAKASFVALSSNGQVLDRDDVSDRSYSFDEAVEDVLDEVAAHYIRPYRY